jgi:hypothetical protein
LTLNTTLLPAPVSFSVMVNSVSSSVSTVAISGSKVQLSLANAIKYGDIVTISYTKPSTNPLQTTAGGLAASISGKTVTNNLTTPVKEATPISITMTLSPNHVHRVINVLLAYTGSLATQAASITPQIIRISDLSGKLLLEKLIVTGTTSIKIPLNLASGIYKVLISAGGIDMASQKMMVY